MRNKVILDIGLYAMATRHLTNDDKVMLLDAIMAYVAFDEVPTFEKPHLQQAFDRLSDSLIERRGGSNNPNGCKKQSKEKQNAIKKNQNEIFDNQNAIKNNQNEIFDCQKKEKEEKKDTPFNPQEEKNKNKNIYNPHSLNRELPPEGDALPKKFKKPDIDDVKAYCTERSNTVDPAQFWEFYEAKGWKVGKSPMKDWRAAVRLWEQRDRDKQPDCSAPPTTETIKIEPGIFYLDDTVPQYADLMAGIPVDEAERWWSWIVEKFGYRELSVDFVRRLVARCRQNYIRQGAQ